MWDLWIIEYDHYIDPKTGNKKSIEAERYNVRDVKSLSNFLLNIKKDINRNPEFFCHACGFWTSYSLVIMDEENNLVCIRNLYEIFMENDETSWNFDSLTIKQLQEILTDVTV